MDTDKTSSRRVPLSFQLTSVVRFRMIALVQVEMKVVGDGNVDEEMLSK